MVFWLLMIEIKEKKEWWNERREDILKADSGCLNIVKLSAVSKGFGWICIPFFYQPIKRRLSEHTWRVRGTFLMFPSQSLISFRVPRRRPEKDGDENAHVFLSTNSRSVRSRSVLFFFLLSISFLLQDIKRGIVFGGIFKLYTLPSCTHISEAASIGQKTLTLLPLYSSSTNNVFFPVQANAMRQSLASTETAHHPKN